jgi:hypothetical protein
MGILNSIVGARFRNEKSGRVVVFPGDSPTRGFVVRSNAEESKIRSFLQMFYIGLFSIFLLGYLLADMSSLELNYALGRPAAHLLRDGGIFLGIYSVVVGVPYFLFWRTYKKAIFSFVSAQDEVAVSGKPAWQPLLILIAIGLIVLGILVLIGATWFVRAK